MALEGPQAPPFLVAFGLVERPQLEPERGRATLRFRAREDHCHGEGVVQGGFVTGWLDAAMANAAKAAEPSTWPATLEIKVSFYRSVRAGDEVCAEGWIERMGRSVAFLAGRLTNSSGEVLATATSTARNLPLPKPR